MRQKSGLLYFGILFVWVVFLLAFGNELLKMVFSAWEFSDTKTDLVKYSLRFCSTLVIVLISYFWLNGLKDVFYTGVYWFSDKSKLGRVISPSTANSLVLPQVDLIYTVCDDFDRESLEKSLHQDYPNRLLHYYILDDSKKPESKTEIDNFAFQYSLKVLRRNSSVGYKAGNINNWLNSGYQLSPYFVILDSDEIIPADFVSKSVKYFQDSSVGIVQANHVATRNITRFAALFSRGVESHWLTYQSIKDRFGFLSLLGHGAMLKTEYVLQVGGVPMVVAEDLALSIKLAENGHRVVFAKDIVCEETYPVDYFAFKKRHSKWTMGNMEFIKKFSGLFFSKQLTWFEKLDILLFVYNLPLTILFISFLLIHLVFFPLIGFVPQYSSELLFPTILTLLAPLLNDMISFTKKMGIVSYIKYFVASVALYGSLYFISFWAAVRALFGKAVFLVTPKDMSHETFFSSFAKNRSEVVFAIVLLTISYLNGQPWSVVLIVVPSVLSVALGTLGNRDSLRSVFMIQRFYQLLAFILIGLGIYSAFLYPGQSSTVQSESTGQVAGVSETIDPTTLANNIHADNVVQAKQCVDDALNKSNFEKCQELMK
jgi:cellulose synthase/poly-beta-1,6-N-acetylglucosamine synthase-like glycosyltransferase